MGKNTGRWNSVDNADFEELLTQRDGLILAYESNSIDIDVAEGLINFLDSVLDEAEEKGLFSFPKAMEGDDEQGEK